MCHVIHTSELYPKKEIHMDQPGLQPPYVPITGENISFLGKIENDGLVSLSNFRFLIATVSIASSTTTPTNAITTVSINASTNHPANETTNASSISRKTITTTTTTISMSTLVNIPLGLIETCEIREIIHLQIWCKNARSFKCTFQTSDLCSEWQRRIVEAIQPVKNLDNVYATAYSFWVNEGNENPENGTNTKDANHQTPRGDELIKLLGGDKKAEVDKAKKEQNNENLRLGFNDVAAWRITKANEEFRLCPSYPKTFIVPSCINDSTLESAARFRAARRVPAVVWRHRRNGAVIARSSQPEVGWLFWRSNDDEQLLKSIAEASHWDKQQMAAKAEPSNGHLHETTRDRTESTSSSELVPDIDREEEVKKLFVMDARSFPSAYANRARGGGYENPDYYFIDIEFMSMANIHTIRKAFHSLRQTIASSDQNKWWSQVEASHWLDHISMILSSASIVAKNIEVTGRSVLVHCSDGWDRTPQIVATAELLLDPFYRTIQGFQILVQREWLDFGHKFADRCGLPISSAEDTNERSPIFLQWLDCVHQLLFQFPTAFEFTDAFLIRLAVHTYSNLFGTFLYNSLQERELSRVDQRTFSVWPFLRNGGDRFRNQLYTKQDQVIWPRHKVSDLVLWTQLYSGPNEVLPKSSDPKVSNMEESHNCSDVKNSYSFNGLTKQVLSPSTALEENSDDEDLTFQKPSQKKSEESTKMECNKVITSSEVVAENKVDNDEEDDEVEDLGVVEEENNSQDASLVERGAKSCSPPTPPPLPPPPPETSTSSLLSLDTKAPKIHSPVNGFAIKPHSSNDFPSNGFHTEMPSNGFHLDLPSNGFHEDPCFACDSRLQYESPQNALRLNSSLNEFDPVDGLSTPEDDIQKRVLEITHKFKLREEALKRELHLYRKQLLRLTCSCTCRSKKKSNYQNKNDDNDGLAVIAAQDADYNDDENPMKNDAKMSSDDEMNAACRRYMMRYPGEENSGPGRDNGLSENAHFRFPLDSPESKEEDGSSSWDYVNTRDTWPTLWVPDHAVSRCTGCDTQFWLGRRKHHCRRCGRIFCADCSENTAPVPSEQLYDPVRVCSGCYTLLEPPKKTGVTTKETLPTTAAATT